MTEGQTSGTTIAFEKWRRVLATGKYWIRFRSPSLREKHSASWAEAGPAKR